MARTPHQDTPTRQSPGAVRARQRIAAQRAAQQRTRARRRLLAPTAAAGAVLAIVAGFVAVKLTTGVAPAARESPAPQSIVSQVTNVPPAKTGQARAPAAHHATRLTLIDADAALDITGL